MALAARAYFGLGACLIAVHFAVGGSTATYEAIGASAAAAVLLAVGRYRPPNALGWLGVGAAELLFFLGDVVYQHQPDPPFPGVPDALYLSGYALFLLSIFALPGRTFPWRDWKGHIDSLLIATCVVVALWMVFLDESIALSWSWAGVVSIAYPVADLLIFTVLLRVGLVPGRRPAAYWLILAALVPLLVADASYVVPALSDGYHLGSWLDVGWLGSYVLVGTAALAPSMGWLATADGEDSGRMTLPLRRVLLSGAALVLLPAAEAWEQLARHQSDIQLLVVAGAVIVAGMAVRTVLLVRELDDERRRARESERKFRMVFERSPIGISVGRGGVMSETNPAFQRMLGYSAEELARMHYTEVTYPDERDLAAQRRLDAGEVGHFAADKRYVAKDGRPVFTHVHVVRDVLDGLGISLVEDVTERRELEEQLRQSQKMDAIGKLAGGIAHDFNNLMTAVLGYSELVLKSLDPRDANHARVSGIHDAATRASALTRQLLAFGRRQMLEMRDVDLRETVARSESLLQRLIGVDVRLVTRLAAEPVVVWADPTQLDQVVVNLAVNAREAMPGGGTLTISAGRDGDDAVLTVADTGRGMDDETLRRAFEPFFTTKAVGEGTGLGLSTVEGIVAQSGGTISVASTVGAGSTFTIRLPCTATSEIHTSRTPLQQPV